MKNIVGLRSGKLVAQFPVGEDNHRNKIWRCFCDCGGTKDVRSGFLIRQKVKTCGCSGKHSTKLPPGEASFNELFGRYKKQAQDRGHSFELTKEQFREHTVSLCFYCGSLPTNRVTNSKDNHYFYNGVDRKDNSVGYTKTNTVPCCTICNRAKRDLPYGEFCSWIENLIKFTKETQNADSSDCDKY